jgi:hypothetical protein
MDYLNKIKHSSNVEISEISDMIQKHKNALKYIEYEENLISTKKMQKNIIEICLYIRNKKNLQGIKQIR